MKKWTRSRRYSVLESLFSNPLCRETFTHASITYSRSEQLELTRLTRYSLCKTTKAGLKCSDSRFWRFRYTGVIWLSLRFQGELPYSTGLVDVRTQVCIGVLSDLLWNIFYVNKFNSRYVRTINLKAGIVRLTGSRQPPYFDTNSGRVATNIIR